MSEYSIGRKQTSGNDILVAQKHSWHSKPLDTRCHLRSSRSRVQACRARCQSRYCLGGGAPVRKGAPKAPHQCRAWSAAERRPHRQPPAGSGRRRRSPHPRLQNAPRLFTEPHTYPTPFLPAYSTNLGLCAATDALTLACVVHRAGRPPHLLRAQCKRNQVRTCTRHSLSVHGTAMLRPASQSHVHDSAWGRDSATVALKGARHQGDNAWGQLPFLSFESLRGHI